MDLDFLETLSAVEHPSGELASSRGSSRVRAAGVNAGFSRTRRRCPERDPEVGRGQAGAERGDGPRSREGSPRWAWLAGEGGGEGAMGGVLVQLQSQ